ncbi:MAG: hypothetical protein BJ554DRAFT_7708, partial [Olpidium bornovanus]
WGWHVTRTTRRKQFLSAPPPYERPLPATTHPPLPRSFLFTPYPNEKSRTRKEKKTKRKRTKRVLQVKGPASPRELLFLPNSWRSRARRHLWARGAGWSRRSGVRCDCKGVTTGPSDGDRREPIYGGENRYTAAKTFNSKQRVQDILEETDWTADYAPEFNREDENRMTAVRFSEWILSEKTADPYEILRASQEEVLTNWTPRVGSRLRISCGHIWSHCPRTGRT